MAKSKSILPEETAAAGYKLSKDAPAKFYHPRLGDVEFATLSLEQAEQLIAAGIPHLEKEGTVSSVSA